MERWNLRRLTSRLGGIVRWGGNNRSENLGKQRTNAVHSVFLSQKIAHFCGNRFGGGRLLHLLTRGFAPGAARNARILILWSDLLVGANASGRIGAPA